GPCARAGNGGGAAGGGERRGARGGPPLEGAGPPHPAEPIGLARHRRGSQLSRRDEVHRRLGDARVDHVRERARDDDATDDELALSGHWSCPTVWRTLGGWN